MVGRCRTPSGRFSGGNGKSFGFWALPSMSLVACRFGLLPYNVRRKHFKCSGWLERHRPIGREENNIFKETVDSETGNAFSHMIPIVYIAALTSELSSTSS